MKQVTEHTNPCLHRKACVLFVVLPCVMLSAILFSYNVDHQDTIVHRTNIRTKTVKQRFTYLADFWNTTKGTPSRLPVPNVDENIYQRFPTNYSSRYRNPCWEEENTLKCVPYFYQIGSYKCGSTDIWSKLVQHPSVIPVAKEIHWWAWRRFGYTKLPIHGRLVLEIRNQTGRHDDRSLQWYFNFISNQATSKIEKNTKLVFGDASISNFWGLADSNWKTHFPNDKEPRFYLADLIHLLQPDAKITAVLRDPVEKMWTTYKLGAYERSTFQNYFEGWVHRSKKCRNDYTEKYCAFVYGRRDPTAPYANVIDQGKYVLYLEEWVRAFSLEHIHVVRLEDWKNNSIDVFDKLIQYLELEPLPPETMSQIVNASVKNANTRSPLDINMTATMRETIQNYYRPWNIRLSRLLNDTKYMWGY